MAYMLFYRAKPDPVAAASADAGAPAAKRAKAEGTPVEETAQLSDKELGGRVRLESQRHGDIE